jgi:hypothetical protein
LLASLIFTGAVWPQADPALQAANTWQRQYQRQALGDVTHAYENSFAWDYKNQKGVVFGGSLGTYSGIPGDGADIMGTNMTFLFSFNDFLFRKAFPQDRPPKNNGGKLVYDEGWGRVLVQGGGFHNFFNGYLEPDVRFASLAQESIDYDMNYPLSLWALDAAAGQWRPMRPLLVEGPPRGRNQLARHSFNVAFAKEYGLVLMAPTAFQRVYSYSAHANQWTLLPRNTADTEFPPEDNYICAAYDLKHGKLIYAYVNSSSAGDTWAYDPGTQKWMKLTLNTAPTPSSRTGWEAPSASLAYDRKNGVTVYLTANGAATWALNLDSMTWTSMQPQGSPSSGGYSGGGMAYDPVRNVSIVYTNIGDEIWTYKYGPGIADRPDPPENTTGVTSATGISITWTAPRAGAAPVKYYVYRCEWDDNLTASSGIVPKDYALLDSTTQTSFSDNNTAVLTAAGVFHSYYVSAVSTQGIESDPSNPVYTTPRVPMGLTATPLSLNNVALRWKPGAQADFAGFNVYRQKLSYPRHNQIKANKLNTALLTASTFTDSDITLYPTAGTLDSIVMYVVTAVNSLGRESGFSPYALAHPDWVTNMRVDTAQKTIHWSPPRCGNISSYLIYEGEQRSYVAGSTLNTTPIDTVTDTVWSYAGRAALRAYKVRALNSIGQLGFFSDVMGVQTKDNDLFGNFRLDFQTVQTVPDTFYNDVPPIGVENRAPGKVSAGFTVRVAPNPFNAGVKIFINGIVAGDVETLQPVGANAGTAGCNVSTHPHVAIYDINGKLIRNFKSEIHNPRSAIEWDPAGLPNGVYIFRASYGNRTAQAKAVLLR